MIRSKIVMGAVVAGLALAPASLALADEASPATVGDEPTVGSVASASGGAAGVNGSGSVASVAIAGVTSPDGAAPADDGAPAAGAQRVTGGSAGVGDPVVQSSGSATSGESVPPGHRIDAPGDVTATREEPASDDGATSVSSDLDQPVPNAADAKANQAVGEPGGDASPAATPNPAMPATQQAADAGQAEPTPAPEASPAAPKATGQSVVVTAQAAAERPRALVNVYRLYNPHSGEHFYTTSLEEATRVFGVGWQWECAVYTEDDNTGKEVYRLYNPNAGAHFYTVDGGERDHLRSLGWRYEGVSWRASGTHRLFRLYNPNSPIGEHLYTADGAESDHLRSLGWNYEGFAWSYLPGTQRIAGRWVVSPAYGSLERYWVQSDTNLAKNRYVSPGEGTGYGVDAFATSSGAVVRNKTRVGSGVVFADNDGRLTSLPQRGWWDTSSIDGSQQWYYIGTVAHDATGRAVTGAITGWLERGGTHCYALADEGFLARNRTLTIDDKVYVFDSEGAPDKYGYQNRAGYYRVSSNSVWLGHAGNPFNYVTPSRIGVNATREDCVNAFIQRAREYLGTPYVWDYAREPGVGVDCVGLVMQCAYATGMDLGDLNPYDHYYSGPNGWHSHDANNLWNSGRAMHVGLGDRQRGDVISWPGHVAIYLGNDQIIEAYSPRTGVRQTSMWSNGTPRGVIRLFQ